MGKLVKGISTAVEHVPVNLKLPKIKRDANDGLGFIITGIPFNTRNEPVLLALL